MYMRLKAEESKNIKFIGLKIAAVASKSLRWILGLFSNACITDGWGEGMLLNMLSSKVLVL